MERPIERLLFIYNADSGLGALLRDVALKLLGRGECALCDLTHGPTGERASWKSCRAALPVPVELLHRDELDAGLRALVGDALPAVVGAGPAGMRVLLGPEAIGACRDIEALVARLPLD